ncbi:hypothetical protein Ppa06_00740 [Planomonospora parontospora subsp. parontospora]|uniref:Transposase DDE domain-containing protein n=2 Tax=Planomonospora parontospora TaxID=58119 RepID=A0AA37BAX4_9ACTN|nr:hypothetical protein GCM10010126_00740 [Planomonospora parontospora]GII06276.1 hypothetical protein Ppa06_00740 [Planomonospora parontospora subsp. parontospora]
MKTTPSHRKITVSADGPGLISHTGGLLLLETLRTTGLDQALSEHLQPWRTARAIHDPGKTITDLALPSPSAATAWPTSPCCAPNRNCSAPSPPIPPSPGSSTGSPPTPPGR